MPTYFSYNALISQRASGYQNTQLALAELIDNSFDAEATRIRVIFLENRTPGRPDSIEEILVCDNGHGMESERLHTCLQFGDTGKTDIDEIVRGKKKGKFGFGLPNASLSQCTCINVYSWKSKNDIFVSTLDLEAIKKTESIEIPPVTKSKLPPYYSDLKVVLDPDHGTIVSWRKCDRLSYRKGETMIRHSEELLGSLYRYLLCKESVEVCLEVWTLNPEKHSYSQTQKIRLIPNDPLFLMENTVIAKTLYRDANVPNATYASCYKTFSLSGTKCLATNIKLADSCHSKSFRWRGREYKYSITTSVAHIDIQKPGIKIGASTGVGQFYGKRDSISFVRADREIATGTFGFYRKTEPQHRWWSIEVQFDGDADDLFGVHNNKQGIKFQYTQPDTEDGLREPYDELRASLPEAREAFWIELTKHIDSAYKAAWKVVRTQGKEWDAQHVQIIEGGVSTLPEATPETTEAISKTDHTRQNLFSDEQRRLLYERLKEKFPNIAASDIELAIKRYDESRLRGCLLYHASSDQGLWSMTEVYGFLIILVNTNHPFYENIIFPLRDNKLQPAVTAIELFISSLAWEEMGPHFMQPQQRNVLEEYRTLVGMHLSRYIRDNSIILVASDFDLRSPLDETGEDE